MSDILMPLLGGLRDLLAWLKDAQVQGVIIGGVAASFLGRPRVTRDIDAVVLLETERWEEFLALGASHGFVPRRADALAFATRSHVLLVMHQPSNISVDISFGFLPFEKECVQRRVFVEVAGLSVPLLTPEDLIVMKAVAHRARDLADIEAVLDAHPKLDLRRIRRWVREFSSVLEMPEISDDLEAIINKRAPRRRREK